jgi:predicted AlkP superfamily phosphohydrolase/phosphomutase
LEENGFLSTKTTMPGILSKLGINQNTISKTAQKFGVRKLLSMLAPETIKNSVPTDDEGVRREQKLNMVNWKKTSAIASGQGLIYTTDESITNEIISALRETSSEQGLVADDIHTREEVYTGEYVDEAPQIVFDQRQGVHTDGSIGNNQVFAKTGDWDAENIRTGLFLSVGLETEEEVDQISILDIAPTILNQLELAVPSDMDGKVITSAQSKVDKREPIPFNGTQSEPSEKIADRLEDLGYLN